MLSIIKEVDAIDLKHELWENALYTMDVIIKNDKSKDLIRLLMEFFPEPVDIGVINDLLGFEMEFIYEKLNIRADEEVDDE